MTTSKFRSKLYAKSVVALPYAEQESVGSFFDFDLDGIVSASHHAGEVFERILDTAELGMPFSLPFE